MNENLNIAQRIEKIIRQECDVPNIKKIYPHTSISRDLGIDGDDISYYLIPALHKEFGKTLTLDQWLEIETLDDMVNAFKSDAIES
jgi:acyl carrier protein